MRDHVLSREPQPIADQWMARCSCGWRKPVSFYEFPTRDGVFAEIDRLHSEHVSGDDGKPQA